MKGLMILPKVIPGTITKVSKYFFNQLASTIKNLSLFFFSKKGVAKFKSITD